MEDPARTSESEQSVERAVKQGFPKLVRRRGSKGSFVLATGDSVLGQLPLEVDREGMYVRGLGGKIYLADNFLFAELQRGCEKLRKDPQRRKILYGTA